MMPLKTPIILHAWMLATRCLSYPITVVSRRLHNRMGAAPKRFAERLGHKGLVHEGDVIWFHAASLGEVMQIGPLADALNRREPRAILVTTTTKAGADWVAREMPYALHQFVPIDIPSAVNCFLDAWSIAVAVFVEGDIWPRLVMESQKRGIPQVLLNARHSKTRERFSAIFAVMLARFALVTCRSERVADSIRALGVPEDMVHVLPDLRVASPKLPTSAALMQPLLLAIGSRPVWLAASTHPDDEDAVLAAHRHILGQVPNALLIVAPRHPRRGAPLQDMARALNFDVVRRGLDEELKPDTQVYIADTLGELGVFFELSQVAFVGGSFGKEGGHNPYEPASFGTAIVSGSRVKNFADAYQALTEAGAAFQVDGEAELGGVLQDLIQSDRAEKMGKAGLAFMEAREDCIPTYAKLLTSVSRAVSEKLPLDPES
ncbi:3-deoxy-D-manno-octulosonic acid transferase [Rhodobacteraceae bacterium]|nr:3-deoxy-D-manno-octulosonic acid transferase [Paracoccaceae bacterium]